MISEKNTLSQVFVKGNDYGTEEWAKQLLQNVTPKKLDNVNAFVGVISFPSDDFLDHQLNQHQTTQFQNSVYVGYMDMLLPDEESLSYNNLGFSKLTFNLSGVNRTFVQLSYGTLSSAAEKTAFKNFILAQFPTANADLVFSRNVMQYLTDIRLSGSNYQYNGSNFSPLATETFTPSIEFEFLVSGYKCLLL
jgi:hypothetical protein